MIPESGYLSPMELTTDWLKFTARLTHNQVATKAWSSSTAQEFLSHCCISTKLSEKIIDHALNVRLMTEMEEENHSILSVLKADKEQYPEKYQPAVLFLISP